MAEEEGKKEEEKLEFTPEGETLGYISLDQARIFAMRTARELPGEYGRRFRNVPLAFDVVETNETEDYYEVTLSLRPQGEFTGTAGREQFFIEKEEGIAHRQVLALPMTRRGFLSRNMRSSKRSPWLKDLNSTVGSSFGLADWVAGAFEFISDLLGGGGYGREREGLVLIALPYKSPLRFDR